MPKWLSSDRAGRPAHQLVQHRRLAGRDLRVRVDARQQPRGEGAGGRRRRHHARGTTRCTRSPPRWPTPSAPAAPSCSSPARWRPLDAFILAEVIDDAGLPAGVFNLVTGTGPEVGEAIAAHPGIDMVSFTGSTRAGKRVAEVASQTLKRVALELGGKSANVLLDDLDDAGFERAVRDGIGKAYINSGQTCTALTRMLVPTEPAGRRRAHRGRRGRDQVPAQGPVRRRGPCSARCRARPRSSG